jgi:hypothetical protein
VNFDIQWTVGNVDDDGEKYNILHYEFKLHFAAAFICIYFPYVCCLLCGWLKPEKLSHVVRLLKRKLGNAALLMLMSFVKIISCIDEAKCRVID